MVTVLIFQSFLLIGAVLVSSSIASKQQKNKAKTTTVSTSLIPIKSRTIATNAKLNHWIPVKSFQLSGPQYNTYNNYAASTVVPLNPETRGQYDTNSYKYYESDQSNRLHESYSIPINNQFSNQGKYIQNNNIPVVFKRIGKKFVSSPVLKNSNQHTDLRESFLPTHSNHDVYSTPSVIKNGQFNDLSDQYETTVGYTTKSTDSPYERSQTYSPNLKKESENFEPSTYNFNEFVEAIAALENKPIAMSTIRYDIKPNVKSKFKFPKESFEAEFRTELYTQPNKLEIPMHRNVNMNTFNNNKVTSMHERYQPLSNQPQLHFHLNPSRQPTLYNSQVFEQVKQPNAEVKNQMHTYDFLENDENFDFLDDDNMNSQTEENFGNIRPLQITNFLGAPTSSIFNAYDELFGQFTSGKIGAQSYTSPMAIQEVKREKGEQYIDEYKSGQSSSTSYEKGHVGQSNEQDESQSREKTNEHVRDNNKYINGNFEGSFEESYREENSYREPEYHETTNEKPSSSTEIVNPPRKNGLQRKQHHNPSKYYKKSKVSNYDSYQQSEEESYEDNNDNNNRKSREIDQKNYSSTKTLPFGYKHSREKPLKFSDQADTQTSLRELEKSHKSNNLHRQPKKDTHASLRKIHS